MPEIAGQQVIILKSFKVFHVGRIENVLIAARHAA